VPSLTLPLLLVLSLGCAFDDYRNERRDEADTDTDTDADTDTDTDTDADTDTDTDADTDTDTDTDARIEQSEICADYLTCLAATDPAAFADQIDTYGPSGACWGSDAELAGVCSEACEAALADLARENPREAACGGDPGHPTLEEGEWMASFLTEYGGSGTDGSPMEVPGTVTIESDANFWWEIEFGFEPLSLYCYVAEDRYFTCGGGGGAFSAFVDGTASDDALSAEGTWHVESSSGAMSGTYTAERL
jgi:hypothetical protein